MRLIIPLFLSFGLAVATAVSNLVGRQDGYDYYDLLINLSTNSECMDVAISVGYTSPQGEFPYIPGVTPECIQFPQSVQVLEPLHYAELVILSGEFADCSIYIYSDL